FFHHMAAADATGGFVASKQYTYVGGKLRFVVCLFSMHTGDLTALIEGDMLGRMRTGAATGVATNYLARRDAATAAVIGTGDQARTQLEAMAAVRGLRKVRVYGREPERRQAFAREMASRLGIEVEPAGSSAEAVRGAAIVTTATTSSQPVLDAE